MYCALGNISGHFGVLFYGHHINCNFTYFNLLYLGLVVFSGRNHRDWVKLKLGSGINFSLLYLINNQFDLILPSSKNKNNAIYMEIEHILINKF